MKTGYLLPIMGMFMVMALSNCSGTNIQPSSISTGSTDTGTTNQTVDIIPKLPTVCTDEDEGVPVITSISTASGSLGTGVTLRGCNFSGFEGDKTVWIENENGIKGILYGESRSTSKQIVFTLKSPLCQTDTSYSGLPCANTLALIPGKYQIYTMPWGKISNKTGFGIVPVNEPPFESMSVWAGETWDFSLVLHNNQWALKIQYGTGARVQVHFQSESSKILNVHLETPRDSMGNIRVAQIVFPDGAMDGPFWKDMTFSLTQSGAYEIILSPNMMAGDPWSWEVDLNLKLE